MSGVVESVADLLYLRDFTADDAVPPTPPPNVDGPAAAQETIDALLTSPFFPSAVDSNQRSLLHVAAALGLGNMVKLLLRGGAPVDRPDRAGMTPVDVALSKGHQRVLAVIADVAARSEAQRQKYEGQGIPAVAAVLAVPVPLAPAPLPFTLVPARLLCLTGGAVCARLVQVCVVDHVAPDASPSDGGTGIQPGDIILKVCLIVRFNNIRGSLIKRLFMQVGNTSLVDDAPWRGQLDDNGATASAVEAAEAEAAFAQHVRAELSMTESQVCQQHSLF